MDLLSFESKTKAFKPFHFLAPHTVRHPNVNVFIPMY